MRKDIYIFGVLVALVVFVTSGFRAFDANVIKNFTPTFTKNLNYNLTTTLDETEENEQTTPFVGNSFIGFKLALASRESGGNYRVVNSFGYAGKYQFGKKALESIGITNKKAFLQNPALQEKAFEALLSVNKWDLRKEIKRYSGKKIAGVLITESGILAAAHLSGAGSVKKFLKSNGNDAFTDGYGTTIKSYFKKFKNYDTSVVKAKEKINL